MQIDKNCSITHIHDNDEIITNDKTDSCGGCLNINIQNYKDIKLSQSQYQGISDIKYTLNIKKHLFLMEQMIKDNNVVQAMNKILKKAQNLVIQFLDEFLKQKVQIEKFKQLLKDQKRYYVSTIQSPQLQIFHNYQKNFEFRKNCDCKNNKSLFVFSKAFRYRTQKFIIYNNIKTESKKKKKKKKKGNNSVQQNGNCSQNNQVQQQKLQEYFQACKDAFLTKVDYFLTDEKLDINTRDNNNWTGFMFACQSGDPDLVKFMYLKKADVYLRNNDGNTGLMLASINGHYNVVNLLVKSNLNLNQCNNDGDTAFTLACKHQRLDIVELLVQRIAKMPSRRTRNKDGYEALTNREQKALKDMLRENKKKNDLKTRLPQFILNIQILITQTFINKYQQNLIYNQINMNVSFLKKKKHKKRAQNVFYFEVLYPEIQKNNKEIKTPYCLFCFLKENFYVLSQNIPITQKDLVFPEEIFTIQSIESANINKDEQELQIVQQKRTIKIYNRQNQNFDVFQKLGDFINYQIAQYKNFLKQKQNKDDPSVSISMLKYNYYIFFEKKIIKNSNELQYYTPIFKKNSLKSIYGLIQHDKDRIKHHLIFSFVNRNEQQFSAIPQNSKKQKKHYDYFMIMILSKPYIEYKNQNIEDSFKLYLQFLKEDYIPDWMDFDTMYFFSLNSNLVLIEEIDQVPYCDLINPINYDDLQIYETPQFTIKLQLKQQNYFLQFSNAQKTLAWYNSINKAAQNQLENWSILEHRVFYNIDVIFDDHNMANYQNVINNIISTKIQNEKKIGNNNKSELFIIVDIIREVIIGFFGYNHQKQDKLIIVLKYLHRKIYSILYNKLKKSIEDFLIDLFDDLIILQRLKSLLQQFNINDNIIQQIFSYCINIYKYQIVNDSTKELNELLDKIQDLKQHLQLDKKNQFFQERFSQILLKNFDNLMKFETFEGFCIIGMQYIRKTIFLFTHNFIALMKQLQPQLTFEENQYLLDSFHQIKQNLYKFMGQMSQKHEMPCHELANFDPIFKKISDILYDNNKKLLQNSIDEKIQNLKAIDFDFDLFFKNDFKFYIYILENSENFQSFQLYKFIVDYLLENFVLKINDENYFWKQRSFEFKIGKLINQLKKINDDFFSIEIKFLEMLLGYYQTTSTYKAQQFLGCLLKLLDLQLREETKQALVKLRDKGLFFIEYFKLQKFFDDIVVDQKNFEDKCKEKKEQNRKCLTNIYILKFASKFIGGKILQQKQLLYCESKIVKNRRYESRNQFNNIFKDINVKIISFIVFLREQHIEIIQKNQDDIINLVLSKIRPNHSQQFNILFEEGVLNIYDLKGRWIKSNIITSLVKHQIYKHKNLYLLLLFFKNNDLLILYTQEKDQIQKINALLARVLQQLKRLHLNEQPLFLSFRAEALQVTQIFQNLLEKMCLKLQIPSTLNKLDLDNYKNYEIYLFKKDYQDVIQFKDINPPNFNFSQREQSRQVISTQNLQIRRNFEPSKKEIALVNIQNLQLLFQLGEIQELENEASNILPSFSHVSFNKHNLKFELSQKKLQMLQGISETYIQHNDKHKSYKNLFEAIQKSNILSQIFDDESLPNQSVEQESPFIQKLSSNKPRNFTKF